MDEDNDVDIDSEFDDDDDYGNDQSAASIANMSEAERRAHHNKLERQRRDQIKESFTSLRDVVPSLTRERASRAKILQSATDYIRQMSSRNLAVIHDIDNLKRQNRMLEQQVRAAERDLSSGNQMVPSLPDTQFRSYAADVGRTPLSSESSDEEVDDDVDLTGGLGPTAASLGASPSNQHYGNAASSSRPRKKSKQSSS